MNSFPLYLMRHGEPELAGTMLGRTDCAVTPAGVQACAEQALNLHGARLVSSDLRRARDCAAAIGTISVDPRWRELDFGDWDGCPSGSLDPAALGRFWDDPDASPPPGGERWSALVARVAEAIETMPAEPTLVVTHGGPMRAALAHLCGFRLSDGWVVDLPYSAVLALRVWDGSPRHAQIMGLWT